MRLYRKKGGHMTQIRYQIALALSPDDYDKLEALKKRGIKTIEIFRKGLEVLKK